MLFNMYDVEFVAIKFNDVTKFFIFTTYPYSKLCLIK